MIKFSRSLSMKFGSQLTSHLLNGKFSGYFNRLRIVFGSPACGT
jgi:hypothetical protein